MKLERYTEVQIDEGIVIYIHNKPLVTYTANTTAGFKIRRKSTGEVFDAVTLYKQIFGADGEELPEPIYDEDDYFIIDAFGNEIHKCVGNYDK